MPKAPIICVAAGLAGLISAQAWAAVPSADRSFAVKAASGGMAEVQAAQLAQQQGASPQVKQFANRMITDHTQANSDLQQIAQQENIDLPAQPEQKDASELRQLRGLNGTSFDQRYAQDAVRDHQQDIALFQREASSGHDPALKAFAQKTLPTLRQHLQLARSLSTSG